MANSRLSLGNLPPATSLEMGKGVERVPIVKDEKGRMSGERKEIVNGFKQKS